LAARDRILDAAAEVMHDVGLLRTTTKQIAAAAGCSEALLYKHFADQQEIFLAVLSERLPKLTSADALVGTATVDANLERLVLDLLDFYVRSFPIAASIFGSAELLRNHRASMQAHDAGPHLPALRLEGYLLAEQDGGRVAGHADAHAVAVLLCGAALHEAFQAAYVGRTTVPARVKTARRLVAVVIGHLAVPAATSSITASGALEEAPAQAGKSPGVPASVK